MGQLSGAVHVFDVNSGEHVAKWHASDSAPDQWFGWAVAIDDGLIVIGAPSNVGGGSDSGAAYVFDATNGAELHGLVASDGGEEDFFGGSVAIDAPKVVVSASLDDDDELHSGSAYVFDVLTGSQLSKLTAHDADRLDRFGRGMAISGSLVAVGSNRNAKSDEAGAVYLFDAATGTELDVLTATDTAPGDNFGVSIAIEGTTMVVGARNNSGNATRSGSAYAFDLATRAQVAKLQAGDGRMHDRFGRVAISDNVTVVGASGHQHTYQSSGAVYLFNLDQRQVRPYCFGLDCPCGNDDGSGGCAGSLQVGARLGAEGSTSVLADDLFQTTSALPPHQLAVTFIASARTQRTFGAGHRCWAGPTWHLAAQRTDGFGLIRIGPVVSLSQSLPPRAQVAAGQTRFFQTLYRDPFGPCGAAHNTSSALAVTFVP